MNGVPAGWLSLAAALAAVGLLIVAAVAWRRRRNSIGPLLRRISWEQLADVVVPDDVDGEIHLDLVLLTSRSILVLDVRHVDGMLFWGEQLEQWTLLDGARRKVLPNPLPGMRARRHAVHALVPRVPVDARILLAGRVTTSGDMPPGVLRRVELAAEFPARGRAAPSAELREAWATLRGAARPM